MEKIIHVSPVDLHTEINTVIAVFNDPPVIGLNGYVDGKDVILLYDIDRPICQRDYDFLEKLPTPSLIMETKKGYHILNFGLYNFDFFINAGLVLKADKRFLGHSLIKGYPSLRMGMKPRSYDKPDLNFYDFVEPIVSSEVTMFSIGHLNDYCNLLGIPHKFKDLHKGLVEFYYKGNVPTIVIYR